MNAQQYYTVDEVAERLRIKAKQVRRHILAGNIRAIKPPGTKRWLIPAARLEATIHQGAQ